MRSRSFAALVIATTAFRLVAGFCPALATPARTAVFVGDGPRGRGCVEWLRLVAASPELVLPAGNAEFYQKRMKGRTREIVERFAADGGKVLTWGNNTDFAPKEAQTFASAEKLLAFIRREASCAAEAR